MATRNREGAVHNRDESKTYNEAGVDGTTGECELNDENEEHSSNELHHHLREPYAKVFECHVESWRMGG